MAFPNPENLAYRGINTGNVKCIAYRGFIYDIIDEIEGWKDVITFSVNIIRKLTFKVEF